MNIVGEPFGKHIKDAIKNNELPKKYFKPCHN